MPKKQITAYASCSIRYTPLKDLLASVNEWIKEYGEDAEIEIDTSYDACIETQICYQREETDEEYTKRLVKEADLAKRIAEQELRELERLKKKYNAN